MSLAPVGAGTWRAVSNCLRVLNPGLMLGVLLAAGTVSVDCYVMYSFFTELCLGAACRGVH